MTKVHKGRLKNKAYSGHSRFTVNPSHLSPLFFNQQALKKKKLANPLPAPNPTLCL